MPPRRVLRLRPRESLAGWTPRTADGPLALVLGRAADGWQRDPRGLALAARRTARPVRWIIRGGRRVVPGGAKSPQRSPFGRAARPPLCEPPGLPRTRPPPPADVPARRATPTLAEMLAEQGVPSTPVRYVQPPDWMAARNDADDDDLTLPSSPFSSPAKLRVDPLCEEEEEESVDDWFVHDDALALALGGGGGSGDESAFF